jgi:hypothetical protein
MDRYKLVSHPPIKEVAEQMTLPSDSPDRFGLYSGQIPGATLEGATPEEHRRLFKEFMIAPESMETVPSQLGRLSIKGKTLEGEAAKVNIDPFAERNSFGTLEIGEVEE